MDGWNYAVKCIHFTTCKQRDRLINEVYLMASFSHPNIVEYHSSWMDESNIYIQMEYCNGGSLETWWKYNQDSSFAEKEAKLCKVIQHIALALDYLHTQENAVHLDIKPANIFVQYHSSVYYTYKLGDFGSMQKIPLANECFDYENSFLGYKKKQELNLSKIECDDIDEGDGRYLAPELLKDQVDVRLLGRADIYAVGCSILELAGGQLLPNHSEFSSEDVSNPPVLLPRGYSVKFASLLSKMLDSDPSKRPSARVLLMDQEIGSTESRILLLQKEVYQLQQENRLMREQLQANSVNCRLSSF
ncbi:wee1-like protein kinase 2 isoform X4 [Schistocerca gregaria]|nr:wee1-like protein kinase 2 isoform X4 [Schistocerca gregaria]